eukprot:scaffold8280_cov59-Phaeocystis_antarctica.AAC.7
MSVRPSLRRLSRLTPITPRSPPHPAPHHSQLRHTPGAGLGCSHPPLTTTPRTSRPSSHSLSSPRY